MTRLEVLATGPLAVFCDSGRPGFAALGVSASGAADRSAYELGQRLLGQGYDAAAIEVTLGGLAVRSDELVWVALTGADAGARLDGRPVGHGASLVMAAGQELRLGVPKRGLRTYLSVRGGCAVETVLGSRSTDVLSGLGPGPLRAGDRIGVGDVAAEPDLTPLDFPVPIRPDGPVLKILLGPRDDWFADPGELARATWQVSADSDRVGVRLTGPALTRHPDRQGRSASEGELASEGMVRGAVQVPPTGQLVVLLADHPVTGGYPVIGVLTPASTDLIAQARPGSRLRFRIVG